jgi:glycosyltransferase involved in cell wall biosynthesis
VKRKRQCLRNRRVFVVGNSRWTTNMAAAAAVFQNAVSCRTIHPAFEPAEFVRHKKAAAKDLLGCDPQAFTVGFGCAALTDRNKDFPAFLKVLGRLAGHRKLEAVVFGEGFRESDCPSVKIHSLGKLGSNRLLSLAYSAMDVFVMTSKIETFGQVALEAQACGTPVCAFEVGGLSDAVRQGETGWLSPSGNIDALAANIDLLLSDAGQHRSMADCGHDWTRSHFTLKAATQSYLDLYQEALSEDRSNSTHETR